MPGVDADHQVRGQQGVMQREFPRRTRGRPLADVLHVDTQPRAPERTFERVQPDSQNAGKLLGAADQRVPFTDVLALLAAGRAERHFGGLGQQFSRGQHEVDLPLDGLVPGRVVDAPDGSRVDEPPAVVRCTSGTPG